MTTDAVATGVGIELGNRHQAEQMLNKVRRIADSLEILTDRKREEAEEKLDQILERLSEREERDRRTR
jgi:N-glycosylase/DNA lyase